MSKARIEQLVTFRIADEFYGLPVMDVREIILPTDMQPISSVSPDVVGVVVLRGDVISIRDFRTLLQKERLETSRKQRIIILSHAGCAIGLLVDEVSQVISTKGMPVESPPASVVPFVSGIWKHREANTFVYVLETNQLTKEGGGDDAT